MAYARNLMFKKDVGRLVVVDRSEKPVGIITMADIVEAVTGVNYAKTLDEIKASEAMSKDLVTISPSRSIKAAAHLMIKHKIGGLPVVGKEDKLVGIITRTDLVRAYGDKYAGELKVSEVMRSEFPKAKPTHSIFYVIKLMEADPAKKVVITDDEGRLLGVIAEKDVALAYIPMQVLASRGKDRYLRRKVVDAIKDKVVSLRSYLVPTAEDIMTRDPIVASPNEEAAEVARTMAKERIGCVPVVDEGNKVIGVVTKYDYVSLVARAL
ncbi:MAG: CBS-domain-containing membrane protein [uncultured Acidilobus sp. CIS]|nr:MAG: CBS-domain-containing membrane protein [uncultured Acidilobus sp. CIS]